VIYTTSGGIPLYDTNISHLQFLFAVNAGSNTVAMFDIDAADPTRLRMVGSPADTLGDFPVTIAASNVLSLVCVANAGTINGVACFHLTSEGLVPDGVGLRSLGLSQTNPPSLTKDGPTEIFFSPDLSRLYLTTKGGSDNGFISVFAVQHGLASDNETRSSPDGTTALFGAIAIPGTDQLLAADASFGVAILGVDYNNKVSTVAKVPVPNQTATCWIEYSSVADVAFVTDPFVNHLVEVDVYTAAITHIYNVSNAENPGLIDFVVPSDFLYALSPGYGTVDECSVIVFDVGAGRGRAKQVQNFKVGHNVSSNAHGMASYM
jgi:hypothetical protein